MSYAITWGILIIRMKPEVAKFKQDGWWIDTKYEGGWAASYIEIVIYVALSLWIFFNDFTQIEVQKLWPNTQYLTENNMNSEKWIVLM